MFDTATLTYIPEPNPDTRQPIALTPSGQVDASVSRIRRLAPGLSPADRAALAADLREILAKLDSAVWSDFGAGLRLVGCPHFPTCASVAACDARSGIATR